MEREQRAGIIDTLTSGYDLVNRRPWLVGLPVLLDLFFWFGPRLSAQTVIDSLLDTLSRQGDGNRELLQGLRLSGSESDLFSLLAVQVPSMIRALDAATLPLAAGRPVLALTDPVVAAGSVLLLVLVGLLLAMLYATPIGQVVRGEPISPVITGWRAGLAWLRLLALVGLLLAAGLAVTVPLAIFTALLAVAGLNLLPLLQFLLSLVVVWLLVYLFFAVDAIVVSQVGPLRAVRNSVTIVRSHFWATLGLIGLTLLISLGLPIVFALLTRVAVGVPVAIVANAYINTGLAAASMLFYRDRLGRAGKGLGVREKTT
jgi:hypothetical protein